MMRYGPETLRRRVYEVTGLSEVFNDPNISINVKSSPEKTVANLSTIAVKEGQVVKLNDTNIWRQRYAMLVPHTFLYYFGSGPAEDLRPHGVIDLELYTDIKILEGNIVRLAPSDDTLPIRTFYFRMSDETEAEDWLQVLQETRYDAIRDERNALLGAKEVLTEQVVAMTEELRGARAAAEEVRRREAATLSELARYDAMNKRRMEQVQALLATAGAGATSTSGACIKDSGDTERSVKFVVSGEAEAPVTQHLARHKVATPDDTLTELAALGEAIAERAREVADLKAQNVRLQEEALAAEERRQREAVTAQRFLDQEKSRSAREAADRSRLEGEVRSLRRDLQDSQAEREEARANLGVVAAACREAEAKVRELQEHRRVLAREVKTSRADKRRLSAALSCATTAAAAAAATAAATAEGAKARDEKSQQGLSDTSRPNDDRILMEVREEAQCEDSQDRSDEISFVGETEEEAGQMILGTDTTSRSSEVKILEEPATVGSRADFGGDKFYVNGNAETSATSSRVILGQALSGCHEEQSLERKISNHSCDERAPEESRVASPERSSRSHNNPDGLERRHASRGFPEVEEMMCWDPLSRIDANADSVFTPPSDSTSSSDGDYFPEEPRREDTDAGSVTTRRLELDPEIGLSRSQSAIAGGDCTAPLSPTPPNSSPSCGPIGESKLSVVVQSLSAGLMETRKSKRVPLLGSLDGFDSQVEDQGDGCIMDSADRDSKHNALQQQVPFWSSISAGAPEDLTLDEVYSPELGNSAVELEDSETEGDPTMEEEGKYTRSLNMSNSRCIPCDVAAGKATTVEGCHGSRCKITYSSPASEGQNSGVSTRTTCSTVPSSSPPPGGRSSRDEQLSEVSSKALAPKVSAMGHLDHSCPAESHVVAGWKVIPLGTASPKSSGNTCETSRTGTSADWFMKVTGRDSERTLPHDSHRKSSSLTSTHGDFGSGDCDTCSPLPLARAKICGSTRSTVIRDTQESGGKRPIGMGEAAAAAAVAAAERGSRASLEAAAAARRWEAKLKGSLISITGGVRWGMCDQKLDGLSKVEF